MKKRQKNYESPQTGNKQRILLGITGSIAAYKSAYLARLLVKSGYQVRVLMTEDARAFITPLTLSAITGQPVYHTFYNSETGEWHNHIKQAEWADCLLIAPLTAQTLAKMAGGHCDNFLLAVYLSATCPVMLAPAMDREMWEHPATRRNLETLKAFGHHIIPPEKGELASGLHGYGRMAEPETIADKLPAVVNPSRTSLKGKKVLVSAGPTYENIDPVRFIGNYSSGKMGYAIAEVLASSGADVKLVSGPVSLECNHPGVQRINVRSAAEMFEEMHKHFPESDAVIMAAAVADFTPGQPSEKKIKKGSSSREIQLKATKDILKSLGKQKKNGQIVAGFSLETENALENARKKLREKNLDFIVLNTLEDEGAGFATDTNKITILGPEDREKAFPLQPKSRVAQNIVAYLGEMIR